MCVCVCVCVCTCVCRSVQLGVAADAALPPHHSLRARTRSRNNQQCHIQHGPAAADISQHSQHCYDTGCCWWCHKLGGHDRCAPVRDHAANRAPRIHMLFCPTLVHTPASPPPEKRQMCTWALPASVSMRVCMRAGAYQVSVTRYQPPGFGPGMTLSSNYESSLLSRGWYVRYNLTTFTSSSATNTNPPTVPLQLPRALASFLTASWPASAGATVPRPPPVTVTDATVATVSDSAWFQPPPRFVRGAYVSDMAFVGRSALVGQLQPQSTLAGGVVTLLPDSQVTQLGEVVTPVSTDGGMSGGGTLGIVGWATGVLRTSQIPTDKIVIRVRGLA